MRFSVTVSIRPGFSEEVETLIFNMVAPSNYQRALDAVPDAEAEEALLAAYALGDCAGFQAAIWGMIDRREIREREERWAEEKSRRSAEDAPRR